MKTENRFFGIIIAVGLFFGGTMTIRAQKSDAAIRQDIREKAMHVIQKGYETYATCSTKENAFEFTRLFINNDVRVYNDLLGLSTEKTLPIGNYARLLNESNVKNAIVRISGISILDEPYKENGKWKVDMSFNKRMSYYDACGVYFSSYDFYHADYNLEATLVYDDVDQQCRIESIKGDIDGEPLPRDYFVFKKTDDRDTELSYRRTPLKFNTGNQAIIAGKFDPNAFSHSNPRIPELHPSLSDCNIATMRYGKLKSDVDIVNNGPKMMLRLNFGLALGKALNVETGNANKSIGNDVSSSGGSFGLEFGYQLMSQENFKLSAFSGLGLTWSNMSDLGYEGDYSYKTQNGEGDIDKDDYTRYYSGLKISQDTKLSELTIPVYLDAEYSFTDMISVYADLGIRLNFNMSKDVETTSASAEKIYGKYDKYGGLILDGDWGGNGFTNNPKKLTTVENELENVKSPIDLMAGAGIRFNIPNSPVAIDLGVGYIMGLSPMIENNASSASPNMIKYTYKDDKEHVTGLANTLKSVKRQSMRLNIGLIYKF